MEAESEPYVWIIQTVEDCPLDGARNFFEALQPGCPHPIVLERAFALVAAARAMDDLNSLFNQYGHTHEIHASVYRAPMSAALALIGSEE